MVLGSYQKWTALRTGATGLVPLLPWATLATRAGGGLAGGGVKRGFTYGATDDFGMHPVEAPVAHHDFHATILHLLGLDHKQLTYRHNGRDFRLTDVHGRVVHDLLA